MLDSIRMQRSEGMAHVALDGGRLTALRQSGSGKAMLPRAHSGVPEIVFLNTSGGLTGGDRLEYSLRLGPGTAARATTQTAERAYRADAGHAQVSVTLELGRGASLEWFPQETILFNGTALQRTTQVDITGDAEFLGIETLVLGRAAMGETVTRLALDDTRRIRRDGRLLLLDPFRLTDAALLRGGAALLGTARAVATLILIGPDTDAALPAVRAELNEPSVEGAASGHDGRLVLRCLAADAWPLRRQMLRLIQRLRPGAIPRCWQI